MIKEKKKNKFNIKEMSLYKTTDRFLNNYNYLKKSLGREPTLEEISDIDQLHYNGTEAVNEAISKTKINKNSTVLDIGSGIGGPARYIARKTKANIYAIEIQNELNQIAKKLTSSYKLNNSIKHIRGDVLKYAFKNVKFDNIVSWLALYHIPERTRLLKKLHFLLKDNGLFYAEDFYLKKNLDNSEKESLAKYFHANHLIDFNIYQRELINNNFEILEITDMSSNWTIFTKNRLNTYKNNYYNHLKVNSKITVNNVLGFYDLAYKLLSNKIIGGIRYIIKKK